MTSVDIKLNQGKLLETDMQNELLGLWRKFLKNDDVSIDDDFFEKGGDSILAMEMQTELQRIVGRPLPETILFEAASVRELLRRLSPHGGAVA
jgi:hypothetical protein